MKTTIKQFLFTSTLLAMAVCNSFEANASFLSTSNYGGLNTALELEGKPIYLTNSKYRMEPIDLNNRIRSKKNIPVILNVSAYKHTPTKGSIHIGDMLDHSFADLKLALGNTPKNREIVVYCGCCSLDVCERVEKAFDLLRANGYNNVKVLNLVVGFDPDWKGKGYATEAFEL